MAFLQVLDVPPLDAYNFTGPVRQMSGVARTLTPTSDVQYGEFMRWLYVGTSGNVSYVKWNGQTQVLVSLAAGVWHPIHSIMINGSGTTATGIVVGS